MLSQPFGELHWEKGPMGKGASDDMEADRSQGEASLTSAQSPPPGSAPWETHPAASTHRAAHRVFLENPSV